jgi:site-specific DNA-methyltransferase (adenine-specific)
MRHWHAHRLTEGSGGVTLIHGDCIDVMAGMDPESVDAIVTDPPYDLTDSGSMRMGPHPGGSASRQQSRGFMGKVWDGTGVAFRRETWEAAYRVAKPSAYLLAFGGTRTVHRMTCALEDAGWIIRDMLVWGYASGFPKGRANLKPAWEPIVMARKPGPLRMLAIDQCRIPTDEALAGFGTEHKAGIAEWSVRNGGQLTHHLQGKNHPAVEQHPAGRWPANIVLTEAIFDGGIGGVVGGGETGPAGVAHRTNGGGLTFGGDSPKPPMDDMTYGDTGTYSRFFLIPKAARSDREPVLGGLPLRGDNEHLVGGKLCASCGVAIPNVTAEHCGVPVLSAVVARSTRANIHPTVKPVDLMRHLVRLVTPTGGTVLDPFLGSGTTGLAAEMEGFAWIGIEREAEYVAIAEARLNGTQRGLGLETA